MRKIIALLSIALLSAGASTGSLIFAAAPARASRGHDGLVKGSVVSENFSRSFYVHAPPSYDPNRPVPALIVFHARGSNAKEMCRISGFNELADKYGFLVVYPEGVKGVWNDGRGAEVHDRYDDVGFVDKLSATLEQKWHVNPRGIFLAGFSSGGFLAQYLALKLPGRFAGVAAVAATLPLIMYHKTRPRMPVPVILVLGMDDPVVPFKGGAMQQGKLKRPIFVTSASQTVEFWVKGNRLGGQFESFDLPDMDENDKTRARIAYYKSTNGADVAIYGVEGGGHAWPRGGAADSSLVGIASRDFDASSEIVRFFAQFGLAELR